MPTLQRYSPTRDFKPTPFFNLGNDAVETDPNLNAIKTDSFSNDFPSASSQDENDASQDDIDAATQDDNDAASQDNNDDSSQNSNDDSSQDSDDASSQDDADAPSDKQDDNVDDSSDNVNTDVAVNDDSWKAKLAQTTNLERQTLVIATLFEETKPDFSNVNTLFMELGTMLGVPDLKKSWQYLSNMGGNILKVILPGDESGSKSFNLFNVDFFNGHLKLEHSHGFKFKYKGRRDANGPVEYSFFPDLAQDLKSKHEGKTENWVEALKDSNNFVRQMTVLITRLLNCEPDFTNVDLFFKELSELLGVANLQSAWQEFSRKGGVILKVTMEDGSKLDVLNVDFFNKNLNKLEKHKGLTFKYTGRSSFNAPIEYQFFPELINPVTSEDSNSEVNLQKRSIFGILGRVALNVLL